MKIRNTILAVIAAIVMPFAASTALANSGCCPGGGKSGGKGGSAETSAFQISCSQDKGGCGGSKEA